MISDSFLSFTVVCIFELSGVSVDSLIKVFHNAFPDKFERIFPVVGEMTGEPVIIILFMVWVFV